MDVWERYIKKAEENLRISQNLVTGASVSLAAFHAQQCVELSVKAMAFKYGFEDFLKKQYETQKLQESQNIHEGPKRNRRKDLKTHLPSKILVETVYDFMDEYLSAKDLSELDKDMTIFTDDLCKMINTARSEVSKTLKELQRINGIPNQHSEKIWLCSLGLYDEGYPITAHDMYNKCTNMKLSNDIDYVVFAMIRQYVLKIKKRFRKNRRELFFRYLLDACMEDLVALGLPRNIVLRFVTDLTSTNDSDEAKKNRRKIVKDLITKEGSVEIMDMLCAPDGPFSILDTQNTLESSLHKSLEKRVNFIWIAYLAVLSPVVVLLYPHAILGRYPASIGSLMKNSEDIYDEQKDNVVLLITETKKTFERIKRICKAGHHLPIFN